MYKTKRDVEFFALKNSKHFTRIHSMINKAANSHVEMIDIYTTKL